MLGAAGGIGVAAEALDGVPRRPDMSSRWRRGVDGRLQFVVAKMLDGIYRRRFPLQLQCKIHEMCSTLCERGSCPDPLILGVDEGAEPFVPAELEPFVSLWCIPA